MEDWVLGLIGFGAFFLLVILRMPIGLAGMVVGFAGLWSVLGLGKAINSFKFISTNAFIK